MPLDISDGQFSFASQATTFWLSSLKVNVEHGSIKGRIRRKQNRAAAASQNAIQILSASFKSSENSLACCLLS